MNLEEKSLELKQLISTFSTEWLLGELSFLMTAIANNRAQDQLGELSSPQRQLYYLAGLLVTSKETNENGSHCVPEKWKKIVELLNEIENEYYKLFYPNEDDVVDDHWKKIRLVAMPTFLSYFNHGSLNYEEQTINWVNDLYAQFSNKIKDELGVGISDFLRFYQNIDSLYQNNFQGHNNKGSKLRDKWKSYSKLNVGIRDDIPDFFREKMKEMHEANLPSFTFMADKGIISRFKPEELVSENLDLKTIEQILNLFTITRTEEDFKYYTETRPGNPIYRYPIVKLENGMFQVFEIKQVLHAIDLLFESICCSTEKETSKLSNHKGDILEQKIVELFTNYLPKDIEIFTSYYVDGSEQDILILWNNHALIIEAKGYKVREPFRDPEKAYEKIKGDFEDSIEYAYKQINRVQQKFINLEKLIITDKKGRVKKEIDTTEYEDKDFGIVVNLNSFGQVQNDLSILMPLEDKNYPWVIKLDDLEVFLLTLKKLKRKTTSLIEYLEFRESLHGKLICSDELELCGAFITNKLDYNKAEKAEIIITSPDLAEIFDKEYYKGLGFKNEKYLKEKQGDNTIFW